MPSPVRSTSTTAVQGNDRTTGTTSRPTGDCWLFAGRVYPSGEARGRPVQRGGAVTVEGIESEGRRGLDGMAAWWAGQATLS